MDTEYLAWERKQRAHERHVAALLLAALLLLVAFAAPLAGSSLATHTTAGPAGSAQFAPQG